MFHKSIISAFLLVFFLSNSLFAQTWVDSLDAYTREKYRPASQYKWTWQNAALLNTIIKEFEWAEGEKKQVYFNYIKKAIDRTYKPASGKTPNAVASGLGLAFLYAQTKEEKYLKKAEKIYRDYLHIRRTPEGAVSHLMLFTELWDDTVFMVGEFLLGMYKATGDEKYLNELAKQFRLHREKLQDKEQKLWVHGWDNDTKTHCTFCSQRQWADKESRRSVEFWGRGNGWIVVTLSDIVEYLPETNPLRAEFVGYLQEMLAVLPALQDSKTGHWFQLPARKSESGNYIESSCTAMFAYGLCTGLKLGIIKGEVYENAVRQAYQGLRNHSIASAGKNYLTSLNVCTGTCIGDKHYYFKRAVQKGKPFGLGMFIQFGRRYEREFLRK